MYEEWCLHFAAWAIKQGIYSLGPTATHVAAFLLSLCRDYGLAPQVVKLSVSAEPHKQGGDGAGQKYPWHAKFCLVETPSCYDGPPAWDFSMALEVLSKRLINPTPGVPRAL